MEIKTKYQYTYFIYPYVIKEEKYEKYINMLLHNSNFSLKLFDKDKDEEVYSYFLPKVRNYMFGSFDYNKSKITKLNEFDNNMKSMLLSKSPCVMFEYKLEKDIQGKTGIKEGIFFNIRNVEIICFNSGICFLLIKTTLDEVAKLSDICNFNYKFRDIYSSKNKLNDYENIKIQTDTLNDIKSISTLIRYITGNGSYTQNINIDSERFITYSYACVGQEYWDNKTKEELLEKEFSKFAVVEPSNSTLDSARVLTPQSLKISNQTMYATTSVSTVLLTSDINTENYTKLPHQYENQFLYNFLYELYKKLYLKLISEEFSNSNNFEKTKQYFLNFTKKIWIEETTNNEIGIELSESWENALRIKKLYSEVKRKYDVLYKSKNIEKTAKSNKWIAIILVILVIVNIINCIKIFK